MSKKKMNTFELRRLKYMRILNFIKIGQVFSQVKIRYYKSNNPKTNDGILFLIRYFFFTHHSEQESTMFTLNII